MGREEYSNSFPEARKFLGEHVKDEEFVALSLCKKAPLWTYEKRLFEIGICISTKELSEKLRS